MTWIQTFTGKQFDIQSPTTAMVDLEDIAHSLSMQCRFNGHCLHFYSVAEHCVTVAATVCVAKLANLYLPEIGYSPTGDKIVDATNLSLKFFGRFDALEILRWGYSHLDYADQAEVRSAFLHDAPEAYTKDLPTPIKRMCPEYKALEQVVEQVVFAAFGLSAWLPLTALVKHADHEVLFVEKRALLKIELNGWGNGIDRDDRVQILASACSIRCLEPREAKTEFLQAADCMGVHVGPRYVSAA